MACLFFCAASMLDSPFVLTVNHVVVTTGLSLSEVQYRVKIEGDRRCKDYETIVSSVCKRACHMIEM